jgi:hypothetical protein
VRKLFDAEEVELLEKSRLKMSLVEAQKLQKKGRSCFARKRYHTLYRGISWEIFAWMLATSPGVNPSQP